MENNPYHPKHSLQILVFLGVESNKVCYCCNDEFKQSVRYCSICNFSICRVCVRKPLLLTIDHKKRHEHTLSYIPREASMTCDVCALDDRRYFIYVCHQCDFVVHKECIYSPWIIKISRHEHRLSFTSSFLRGERVCGVCRKKVDENYGGYSCVDKGCYYVVHSKCATRKDIWDGKELEGVPEEEVYEDIAPFKEIGDGIIQHFSHNHHMRLRKEIYKANEESIYCQACALLVYDGDTFSCMECDFVLHKVCAYLPRKKQLVLHPHPLVLQKGNLDSKFNCSACIRTCNSFRYKCDDCSYYLLDMHCASVSEPLDYQCHPHPLFLPSIQKSTGICSICQRCFGIDRLECVECDDFVLCFHCATLPTKFMYKMHDEHPLILLLEQDASSHEYWCDVCEEEIYAKNGIYICKDCDISVHVSCLLGVYKCMLPGKEFMLRERKFHLLPNNHLTRYICNICHGRCQDKIVYKTSQKATYYCSMACIWNAIML